MQRMYVSVSLNDEETMNHLCSLVKKAGLEDYCFVRDEKIFTDTKELMMRAKEEIEKSDWFLIDMTEKPTGRAIEAGIAYSLGKKIVTIMKKGTEIKDTTRGISDFVIEYENIDEIVTQLSQIA